MNRCISYIVLIAGVSSGMCQRVAFGNVLANEQNSGVSMTITKLQVNDQTLELTYKIKNDSDHDIWICDSVNIKSNRLDYEAYVAKDAQTLVIRKRFDLPAGNVVLESDFTGRYIRLRPGQERADCLLVTLPPMTNRFFDAEIGKANYTKRVALEIGYYDEDLRSLILDTVEVADKLSCDTSTLSYEYHEIYTRYFQGLLLDLEFNDRLSSYFRESVNSGGDEILMPPLSWVGIHLGEKVLRLTVDGVYIRCWGEPPLSETVQADVTMALTGFDINDTKLKLNWKIKNNSGHDIWICDSLIPGDFFEWFLDTDNETLMIRRRFDLSVEEGMPISRAFASRYVRLPSGQEKADSISLTVPVEPHVVFSHSIGNAESAKSLILEIGFYNEDLPGLILEIVEIAEKIYDEFDMGVVYPNEIDVFDRFFGGFPVAMAFNHDTEFRVSVTSGVDEIKIPYMRQVLHGEKILRLVVDNVSIPYKSNYPPLND